jgi:division protein CdvB (Snf7/Vps24/ESCRT-III family)
MTNMNANPMNANTATPAADTRQIVLKEIETKWGKFSQQELSALKGRDDLVTQVVAKYGTENAQAQRDVDAVLKGRQI